MNSMLVWFYNIRCISRNLYRQKLQRKLYVAMYAPFTKNIRALYIPTITTFTDATEIQATYILSLEATEHF